LPAQGPLSVPQFRRAQWEAARRVVPVLRWSARLSGRPRSGAWPVRRDAAVAPSSCFRQVAEQRQAERLEPAWSRVPAAAWRLPVGAGAAQAMASPSEMKAAEAVAQSAQPVASVLQARPPAEGAVVASDAQVQPPGAAEVLPGPSAQQPGAAAEASGAQAEAQPPEAEEAAEQPSVPQPEAAGVALDAEAEPQQAVAAEVLLGAEVRQPGAAAAEEPGPLARQPAAGHPSAPPSWRPGEPLPWLAPPQSVRSAHAMRRSRTASPSKP
jgi:hypothetical protein